MRSILKLWLVAIALVVSPPASRAATESADAEKGSIKGKVVHADGKPAAGVPVRLMHRAAGKASTTPAAAATTPKRRRPKGAAKAKGTAEAVAETTADAAGEFAFADVAPGRYVVVTRMKGIGGARQPAAVTGDTPATVTLTLKAQGEVKPKAKRKAKPSRN